MDASPDFPPLVHGLADIAAGKEDKKLRDSPYYRKLAEAAAEREAERKRQVEGRPTGQERWYLIREARRFNEDDAAEIFQSYAVESYCPKYRTLVPVPLNRVTIRRRKGFIQREEKLVPLFKGFRLVCLDFRRPDWREIFDRARVCGMLASGQNGRLLPHPIPERVLLQFREREALGALPGSLSMRELGVAVGDAVRICEGQLSGYNGTVERLPDIAVEEVDEDIRVRLVVMMFGRVVPVEISLSHIEKL